MTGDLPAIAAIAAGWSVVVGLAGLTAALGTRRRSLHWTVALLVVVAVGGIVAGVAGTAQAMFLSQHDLAVALVVCAVSGVVAAGFAWWLAHRVVLAARRLEREATRLGTDGTFTAASTGPREFDAIARELARSADRLRQSAEREARTEESRRELVAWVSHDLRTPLAGMRAMAEALEDGLVDEPRRYHAQIRAEIDRLATMVDDLFELSQIHAGALRLAPETIALHDVVSETIAAVGPLAQHHGVRIGGQVDPDILVHADPGALSRVVGNLVMNAIRHTPADGSVDIGGAVRDGTVELSVSDQCGGIPAEDLGRVFDTGWRGLEARTPDAGVGAGFGLAIVKGLIEAHQGTVEVANAMAGCRFVVRLPA